MPLLTKEQILAAEDQKILRVDVPEWGEDAFVFVRSLNGFERDQFEAGLVEFNGNQAVPKIDNYRPRLCGLTICDEKGNRLFTDREIAAIGKKNGSVLDRIASVASQLSGMDEAAVRRAAEKLKNAPRADLPSA